ncbi:hypothetical protein B9Z55_010982 [Caenorhabditis nigoni]|uniref:Uncharacterized protein n=1 Tax=Caenorhabditis nigoni TaxID=1611254 RepID=A0A2G5UIA3_9PELO|nr:hypothetical protein B9Z55_010982 [Caenorhabditis nigoni]
MATPSDDVPKELEESEEEITKSPFQFNLFEDLLHGIHPDTGRHHRRRYGEELPTDNYNMNSLVAFLGGFEKWNELNEDCRMAVVKCLSYNDRCQLGICSKKDYDTVKSTPLDVYSISIHNDRSINYKHLVVEVQLHPDYSSGFKAIFSQLGRDTQIQLFAYNPNYRTKNRSLILKSCNYIQKAVKFAENWMKRGSFQLKDIRVELENYPIGNSQIKSFQKCEFIRIGADDLETLRWWIKKLPNRLEIFELGRLPNQKAFTIPSDLLNAPQIMQTSVFKFWCRADFSDEQLLSLKANDFIFHSVSITDKGINQYIKKWINGNGVPNFKRAVLWTTEDRNFDEITRELEYREWERDFENEQTVFCRYFDQLCGRGRCVQIYSETNQYESITLNVSSNCVAIYGTGHKKENYEKTEYSIRL